MDEEIIPGARAIDAAALGEHIPLLRCQVKNARAAGATMRDFREALYLITVKAGVPKGIEVTRVLMELFDNANEDETRR